VSGISYGTTQAQLDERHRQQAQAARQAAAVEARARAQRDAAALREAGAPLAAALVAQMRQQRTEGDTRMTEQQKAAEQAAALEVATAAAAGRMRRGLGLPDPAPTAAEAAPVDDAVARSLARMQAGR
jgi:hypothetical protein